MANQASFCHVFLSFRGETRNKFTCFLYEALKAEGFVAFMDKSDIIVGDEVDSTIQEGIKSSMSAIIVFSQNYAYSTWCLDELVLILERWNNSRYFIIPIYYEVENKDIKHQLGSYGLALEKHRTRHSDKLEKWKQALTKVGNILGVQVEGLQSIFIQNTVKLFREKFVAKFPEIHLTTPKKSDSPSSSRQPSNDKVILYMTSINNGLGANGLVKKVLNSGAVVYEEKNCTKEPKYLIELEELVDKDNVRFPLMVIVNGKDLCGDEEVEGLDDFDKRELIQQLKMLYTSEKSNDIVQDTTTTTTKMLDTTNNESQQHDQDTMTTTMVTPDTTNNESHGDTMTKTLILRDINQNIFTSLLWSITSRVGVHITNRLSNTVAAHCQSGDLDFGQQQLVPNQSMQGVFLRNPFGRTMVWCNFREGSRSNNPIVYDETVGLRPTDNLNSSMLCYWEIRDDGFYFRPSPPTPWVKIHDW